MYHLMECWGIISEKNGRISEDLMTMLKEWVIMTNIVREINTMSQ